MTELGCDITTNPIFSTSVEECGFIPTCPNTVEKLSICNFLPLRAECDEWRNTECFCEWRLADANNLTTCEISIKEAEEA